MPIINKYGIRCDVLQRVWAIEEPEEWFLERLRLIPEEQRQLEQIKGRRRLEWLATRYMIMMLSNRTLRGPVLKDEWGKPWLQDSDWHISISHSFPLAMAVADPLPVGVDIQKLVAKIKRISHKFISDEERDMISGGEEIEYLHILWSAKEAMYKAFGRRGLDFCNDLHLDPFHLSDQKTTGYISKGKLQKYAIYYGVESGYCSVIVKRE